MALAERFVSCRAPVEVWGIYTEFLQKAAADYQKEFAGPGKFGIVVGS